MPGEPSSQPTPRFRVAIIGGGIAGLTLAVALGHFAKNQGNTAPPEVHLYESGPEITTVGAGISVWPRTWAVMRALGLYDDLSRASVQALGGGQGGKDEFKTAFVFRKSNQPHEGYEFGRAMVPNGSTTMHRADMVDVLVKHIPPSCTIHTSKRLLSYTSAAADANGTLVYTLHFADGSTAEADVIVGGDGIKSKVRAAMYDFAHARDCAKGMKREECERCGRATPKWTGTVGYRFLIPSERMREVNPEHHALKVTSPMSYSGKEKHIITYPISHGKYLNWIGFVTIPGGEGATYPHKWVIDSTKEEVTAHFSGWEPEVDQMLQLVEKPTLWAIHVIENLPFAVDGCVALMGDAVHAMTTHFGAGGGQAIEDAFILGRLLADPRTTLPLVSRAFQIYEDVRLPFARTVVNDARKVGLMYEFNWPGLYNGAPLSESEGEGGEDVMKEETRQLGELAEVIQEIWQWQWKEKVEDQWGEVDRRFEQLVKDKDGVAAASDAEKKVQRRSYKCLVM
ncbi:hypothetical protein VTO73DRAFT_13846 [Trametes versicolor]